MIDLENCGGGRSSRRDGTEGTVTVGWFQGKNKVAETVGCIVKNDEEFRKLVNFEGEKPKYFAYIPGAEMNSNETFKIRVHRFTHTKSPKKCKVQNLQNKKLDVHDDHGYIFVPCEDESEKKTKKFNKSRFLEEHSKSIIEIPPDDVCKSGNVMGLSKKEEPHGRTTFFSFEIKASSSNSYYIENDRFDKLEDTGPLLTENNEKKTLVGYYEKSGNEIKIHTLSTDDKEPRTVLAERALLNEMSDSPAHGVEGITVESTGNQQANLQPQTDANTQGSQTDVRRDRSSDDLDGIPFGVEQQPMFLSDFFEKDAENIRALSRYLDRRSLVIKNYEDLANLLNAPPLIIAKCKSNTIEHSPTLELMQLEEVSTLSVNALVEKFKAISRNDVVNKIKDNIPENERESLSVKDALIHYEELFKQVAAELDTATMKNWKCLGRELGFPTDKVEQIGLGCNPTERLLVDYVYKAMKPAELTVASFRDRIRNIERTIILNLLQEFGITEQDDSRSIKDVIPPDSEIMRRLCLELNKEVSGLNNWKHLALSWGIEHEIYSQFEPKQKTSPTEILLKEWLISERPTFSVNALCSLLGQIERNDAKAFLEEKLLEYS